MQRAPLGAYHGYLVRGDSGSKKESENRHVENDME